MTAPSARRAWYHRLSFRILVCVTAAVLIVEALIFVPSASNFRTEWMLDRVQAARVAALALEAAPSRMVSKELADDLLMRAEVLSVAELSRDMREQLLASELPVGVSTSVVNIYEMEGLRAFSDTLDTLFASSNRLLIIRDSGSAPGRVIEVVVPEAPLQMELREYGLNILGLSLIISVAVGALLYLMLVLLVVRPMRRVTAAVVRIGDDPSSWTRRLQPTTRRDEIGEAQNALADMEAAVSDSIRQQERLAQLGEAVAKINHDLRNSLATAQLVSDGLSRSEDPRVAKTLPRLERALERAIGLASDTLKYGRSSVPEAQAVSMSVKDTVDLAAEEALSSFSEVRFENTIDPSLAIKADPDHIHRICANLMRNAAEAMAQGGTVTAKWTGSALEISDTGPGLPDQAKENLFKPFAGSTRRDGTGLGLALSRDLARSMGGELVLRSTGETGTCFAIELPEPQA